MWEWAMASGGECGFVSWIWHSSLHIFQGSCCGHDHVVIRFNADIFGAHFSHVWRRADSIRWWTLAGITSRRVVVAPLFPIFWISIFVGGGCLVIFRLCLGFTLLSFVLLVELPSLVLCQCFPQVSYPLSLNLRVGIIFSFVCSLFVNEKSVIYSNFKIPLWTSKFAGILGSGNSRICRS